MSTMNINDADVYDHVPMLSMEQHTPIMNLIVTTSIMATISLPVVLIAIVTLIEM